MTTASARNGAISIKAYRGDAKTLLAFDLKTDTVRTDLAGFTIHVQSPEGVAPFLIQNNLRFQYPGAHA